MRTMIGVPKTGCAVLALVVVGLLSLPAAAQSGEVTEDQYRVMIEQGISEFELGNWAEARALFQKAHEISPSARTLRGLGMVEFELRHYVRSVALLEESLSNKNNPLTQEQRQQVEALLNRARAYTGSYRVEIEPTTALITVDGATVQPDAIGRLWLDAGDHTLKVTAPGFIERTLRLDVRGGEQKTLSFILKTKASENPVPPPAAGLKPVAEAPKDDALSRELSGPPKDLSKKDEAGGGGVLEQWWFWTAVAVVAGGATAAIIIATSKDEYEPPFPGDDGITVTALSLP